MAAAVVVKAGVRVVASLLETKKGRAFVGGLVAVILSGPVLGGMMLMSLFSPGGGSVVALMEEGQGTDLCGVYGEDDSDGSFGGEGPEGEIPESGDGYYQIALNDMTDEQLKNTRTIIGVAKSINYPGYDTEDAVKPIRQKGAITALVVAMVESRIINIDYGDRDSVGLFQQRPSMGWGTVEELTNPVHSSTAFFYGKTGVPGLVNYDMQRTVGDLSNTVQRPAASSAQRYYDAERYAADAVLTLWNDVEPIAPAYDRDVGSVVPDGGGSDYECDNDASWEESDGLPTGTIGAWGGFSNGKIPAKALTPLPWQTHFSLQPKAAAHLIALSAEYKQVFGKDIMLVDGYRTYARQVQLKKEKPFLAAPPGWSNHGWGLAIDIHHDSYKPVGSAQHSWLVLNAPRYGWHWPEWARGAKYEPWHYEFFNDPKVNIGSGSGPNNDAKDPV